MFQQLRAYCDDFTTVNNVTSVADTGGAVNSGLPWSFVVWQSQLLEVSSGSEC